MRGVKILDITYEDTFFESLGNDSIAFLLEIHSVVTAR
jgi:hypothetical protein